MIKKQERKGKVHEVFYALTSPFLKLNVLLFPFSLHKTVAHCDRLHFNFHYFLTENYLLLNLARL